MCHYGRPRGRWRAITEVPVRSTDRHVCIVCKQTLGGRQQATFWRSLQIGRLCWIPAASAVGTVRWPRVRGNTTHALPAVRLCFRQTTPLRPMRASSRSAQTCTLGAGPEQGNKGTFFEARPRRVFGFLAEGVVAWLNGFIGWRLSFGWNSHRTFLHLQSPDSTPHAPLSQCIRTVGTRIYGVRKRNEESIISFSLASRRPLVFLSPPRDRFRQR